jgi:signal transduction histidine kinase
VHDVSNAVVNESIVLKQMIDGEYGSTLQEIKAILGSLWQTNNRVIQLIDMYRSARSIDRFIGVNPSEIGEFDICDLLNNVYQEYLPLAKSNGLKLHSEMCEEYKYGTKVNGDAIHIYRMISNLVKNALQYTKTGDVFLKLVNQGNDLTVLIEDTGIGIKSE